MIAQPKNQLDRIRRLTDAKLVECRDRQHWLEERVKSCGGSDSPPILGESGYGSIVSVWADKTSPALFNESTQRQKIGLGLEPFCCNLYEQEHGGQVELWPAFTLARHPAHEYIHATPDAVLFDNEHEGPGSLSIKTWSEYDQKSWIDAPPISVQIQIQQELAVLGWKWGYVAVLFGSQRLERFYVERDDRFITALLTCLEEFWAYVVDKIEPPIDESRATAKALARLHPNDNGTSVYLPIDADAMIESYQRATRLAKVAEQRKVSIANQLKVWIGDATYGITPQGRCACWKTQTRKAFSVAESTSRVMRLAEKTPKSVELPSDVDCKVASRVRLPRNLKIRLVKEDPHCRWCNAKLTMKTATFEHLVPLALGGTNEVKNISIACVGCNSARGSNATLPLEPSHV